MRTITIVGASGAIGRRVLPYLTQIFSGSAQITGTYYRRKIERGVDLDVTDAKALQKNIAEEKPWCIIWLSGSKDVSRCEQDPDYAYRLNTRPVETLINAVELLSPMTKVIYLSSDYLFEGTKGLYKENDICEPRTNYGRSKQLAEQALQASKVDYLILRTSAIMSRDNGFLGWFLNQLAEGKLINLYTNTYFSPTPIEILNRAIGHCLKVDKWSNRIVHVAGSRTNRFQFGLDLARALELKTSNILPCTANLINSTFQADLSLQTSLQLLSLTEDSWRELIKEAKKNDSIY